MYYYKYVISLFNVLKYLHILFYSLLLLEYFTPLNLNDIYLPPKNHKVIRYEMRSILTRITSIWLFSESVDQLFQMKYLTFIDQKWKEKKGSLDCQIFHFDDLGNYMDSIDLHKHTGLQ